MYVIQMHGKHGWFILQDYIETQSEAEAGAIEAAEVVGWEARVIEIDINNLKDDPRVVVTY